MKKRISITINPLEAAISFILIWGAILTPIPLWAKILLTIFFFLDSCSVIPTISFHFTEKDEQIKEK